LLVKPAATRRKKPIAAPSATVLVGTTKFSRSVECQLGE
jgi:hypothetical protein